jgi:3-methyladenine DNA glycosylase AlkD
VSKVVVKRPLPREVATRLKAAYESARDAEQAVPMTAYMRDQFPFLGIKTPDRRALDRQVVAGLPEPSERELHEIVRDSWKRREREYQYFGSDYFSTHVGVGSKRTLRVAHELITTKSWWDTIDALAARVVGRLVFTYPELTADMDRWIDDDNFWIARTAILHQNGLKARTDADRLFDYCLRRASDQEFFLRKAIGWALREYSKTDPRAVERFVRDHDAELSGLSKREALKVIERARRGAEP